MTAVAEPPAGGAHATGAPTNGAPTGPPASGATGPEPTGPKTERAQCAHCGSPLAEDQEWCLECGSARTLIHPAPDWRIPLVVIGVVLLLVLVAFGTALVSLSGVANRSAAGQTSRPVAAAPIRAPRRGPSATKAAGVTIASWPTRVSGWTVVLARRRTVSGAHTVAQRIGARGTQVGVLDSTLHPSMTPGFWIVFSGRYPDRPAAAAAAAALRVRGTRGAVARRVAPPGGI